MLNHIEVNTRPLNGLLRLKDILAPRGPIPVSRSTWYAGVQSGRFPKPVTLGLHAVAWRAEDIAALIAGGTHDEIRKRRASTKQSSADDTAPPATSPKLPGSDESEE